MKVNNQTLKRLSNLGLEQYSGNLAVIKGREKILFYELFEYPVEVQIIAKKGICDDKLFKILLEANGKYETFTDLRNKVSGRLAQEIEPPGWNLLSVLFDGIYVGEPEDLLNYRKGNKKNILYPTKGLGKKLAKVKFLN